MFKRIFAVLLMTLSTLSWANTEAIAKEKVIESMEGVLKIMEKYDGDETRINEFSAEVETLLDPVVNYTVIVQGVMGKYFDKASKAQKVRFLRTFRQSMIDTYAKGMLTFTGYTVELAKEQSEDNSLNNTQVYVDVISPEGERYKVIQTVFYHPKKDVWQMRNVIFNGINLGKMFQNQFEQLVHETNGDLDKTIERWEEIQKEAYSTAGYTEVRE